MERRRFSSISGPRMNPSTSGAGVAVVLLIALPQFRKTRETAFQE